MPLLFSVDNLSKGTDLGTAPTWSAIAFAIPVAMLAYTGLETVANLAAETREPGRTLPRSLFVGIGGAVVVSFLIALVALSAYPADPETQLGTTMAARAARGRRRRVLGAPARGGRRRPAGLHRLDRGRDPRRRDHNVVLGRWKARILARTARHAPARLRAPEPEDADLAGHDRLDSRDLGRDPPDREGRERPGALPGEPLQLWRPDRVHGGAGRSRAAPLHRAGPPAPVPGAGQRPHPGDRGALRRTDRGATHLRDLDLRHPHARCGAHRRADLARVRCARLRRLPHQRAGAGPRPRDAGRSATSSRTSRARTSASSSR